MPPSSPVPRPSLSLLVALWSIPALLATIETVVFSRMGARPLSFARAFLTQAPGWYAWALLTPVVLRLGSRWRAWRPVRPAAAALHLLSATACAALVAVVNAAVNHVLRPSPYSFPVSVRNWFLGGLPASVVAYFGILAIGYLLFATLELRERERDAARLEAQLSEAQVHALRMQLQPHFLFNALNAVMALIRDRSNDEAVRALAQLSDLLRGALRDPAHEVTLAQELAFIGRYLDIEQLRLGDRLRVAIEVPDDLGSAPVPTFVRQPLVENAIKHGVSQARAGGTVRISACAEGDTLRLVVANDGPAVSATAGGTGVGVANTRARLQRLYGAGGTLTLATPPGGTGAVATVTLPFRRGA